ncbi:MAG: flagellar filament capping protein FliD [Selenomonadaceae bacterium]|nr:flagellar filament capping protein FliD [Selenomonadaceae bacterium]
MPTVNAITRQVELTADVSAKFFRDDFQRSAKSILITGSLDTAANLMLVKDPKESTADDSILIQAPIDTAADMVKSKFGLRPTVREKLGSYAEERENFNSEFDETMSSLKKSADKLEINLQDKAEVDSAFKNFTDAEIPLEDTENDDEKFFREDNEQIPDNEQIQAAQNYEMRPVERFENFVAEYLTAETSNVTETIQNPDSTRDALSDVRNFVNTFNSTVDYLNENRDVSNRMNALVANFGDNETLTQSLDAVGISVNESGKLHVNENKLVDALSENSSDVNAVLGQNGLAGRMSRNVDLANSQRENLFPTVTDYAGDKRDEPTESLYAVQNNRTAAYSKENAGYFLNMTT